jgi:hypothetical protein
MNSDERIEFANDHGRFPSPPTDHELEAIAHGAKVDEARYQEMWDMVTPGLVQALVLEILRGRADQLRGDGP